MGASAMTTISNMNIVVQQSGGAKNAQNVRHMTQEYTHLMATQQKEKDLQQRTTVQHSEDADQTKLDKDRPDKRRKRRRHKDRRRGEPSGASVQESKDSGKLLDTVA
jgi:hypothetical protein